MFGWVNRLLRVDLSTHRIWAEETVHHFPDFLGGRGLAAKIVWDEYPQPVAPFDPRNPLIVTPGALTGTIAPYSGRTCVASFSPICDPYNWFTRSNIGSDCGAMLKRAGYDGLVVTGASDTPVRILISDDEVSILPADDCWGLDAIDTQEAISAADGEHIRTLTIGPAGELLARVATVHTAYTSAAGHGGFGAVMGSKKLKAISVIGTGRVPVADAEELQSLFRAIGAEARTQRSRPKDWSAENARLQDEAGGGSVRPYACTASCPAPCRTKHTDIRGVHFDRKWTGVMACCSGRFGGGHRDCVYDWDLGFRGAFELNMYANRLGLNHWELLVGIIPWLRMCHLQGLIEKVNGHAFDLDSCTFWANLLHDIAYRVGAGDALAEGGWRAAEILDWGVEIMRRYYTGWGYPGHWDGHAAFINPTVFPFWLVGTLHWAVATRDPMPSMHGYVEFPIYWGPLTEGVLYSSPRMGGLKPVTWEHLEAIGERVYGRSDTLDPTSGYDGKELPAAFHDLRSVMKDSLPTDDRMFPLIYSYNTEDRFCRIGDIEGPDVEAAILRAGTGLDWDTAELERASERVLNMERAIVVRHWGRTRTMDERVLPSFEYDENWVNPEIGARKKLERSEFSPLMDAYYALRGWDVGSGWPTEEKLRSLGLNDVHDKMVDGAKQAQAHLPELPPVAPVIDWHKNDPERLQQATPAGQPTSMPADRTSPS
jgi:aldehyde:ferredoxin oxidoreductase